MKAELKRAYHAELIAAKAAAQGDVELAFHYLARAHILSQRYALAHTSVHLRMLRLGWRRRDGREILGQISRTLAALMFSRIWVPLGNAGRASVSALKPMPVPPDLLTYLQR